MFSTEEYLNNVGSEQRSIQTGDSAHRGIWSDAVLIWIWMEKMWTDNEAVVVTEERRPSEIRLIWKGYSGRRR